MQVLSESPFKKSIIFFEPEITALKNITFNSNFRSFYRYNKVDFLLVQNLFV